MRYSHLSLISAILGCTSDTDSMDNQQIQIDLLQQQNALLQDQIDQLEQTEEIIHPQLK